MNDNIISEGESEYQPVIEYCSNGFSYDQRGYQYGTLYAWSSHYGIPHNSFLRALEWKQMKTFSGFDESNRSTNALYCEKDLVDTCVMLYHQAKLPVLDHNSVCSIEGVDFITRQWFTQKFPFIRWPRVNRVASIIEKNWGMKLAKFHPKSGVPQFLKVYRITALSAKLEIGTPIPEELTTLEWNVGERLGTIPLWSDYLYVSTEWLRWALKDVSPTKKVRVGNGRIQDAFWEDIILDVMQMVVSRSQSILSIESLEEWRSLPAAWETDRQWNVIPDHIRDDSTDLVNTTSNWAYEFDTTSGAIEQLIKRRKAHENGVFGRSWIRLVRLYTRQFMADILANKKPWGTKRKKKRRKVTAD